MEALIQKVVLAGGDLKSLTADEKYQYCKLMAEKVGLQDELVPFKIISFDGREVLYADKGTAELLRKKQNLSFTQPLFEKEANVLLCTIGITDGKRTDYDCGAVSIEGLSATDMANTKMACMTKAKRRATLSFCGLGMIDESEFDTISNKISTAEVSDNGLQVSSSKIEKSEAITAEAKNLNAEKKEEVAAPTTPTPTPETPTAEQPAAKPELWLIHEIDNPATSAPELWERVTIWFGNRYTNDPATIFNDNYKRTAKTVKALLKAMHSETHVEFVASFNPEFVFVPKENPNPNPSPAPSKKEDRKPVETAKPKPETAGKKRPVFSAPGSDGRDIIERMKLADEFAGQEARILDLYPDLFPNIEAFYKFATLEQIALAYE